MADETYGYVTADGGFTLETWFRRTANPPASRWAPILHQATQSSGAHSLASGRQIWVGINPSGGFEFHLNKEDGTSIVVYLDAAPTGYSSDSTWHHFALRLKANGVSWDIFLDGEVYAWGTASAPWDVTTGVLTVAGEATIHRGYYSHLYDMRLAYYAVYNRELTDNKVFQHYTAGNGGTVYYGDTETERIARILDWADVPLQSIVLDDPVTVLQGINVADSNALDKLQETAEAGFGMVFADGQSRLVYHNRRHRYNRFNGVTIGESLQSAPETEFQFSTDKTWVFNDVRGSRPFGGTIRLQDPLSRAKYGRKVYTFTIPITNAAELRNAVTWFLGRYGTARPRVSGVKLNAVGSDLIEYATTGGLQIGDSMTIMDLDAGNAPDSTMRFIVEGMDIDADFKNQKWSMTFNLSPYELNRVFQIGVSMLGDGSHIAF